MNRPVSEGVSVEGIINSRVGISDAQFRVLSQLVTEWTGVCIPASKRPMLQARLATRLRALRLGGIDQYLGYLRSAQGQAEERGAFIDVVTTHHTMFFRENEHFRFLAANVLPERRAVGGLRIWSAACSTGEEVWSLAMTLAEANVSAFTLIGMDVSRAALRIAHRGVYPRDATSAIPDPMRRKWLMDSRDEAQPLVRIVPELRAKAQFMRVNLMDDKLPSGGDCDILFVRNVLIYFQRDDKQAVLSRLCQRVKPNGWVFLGMAESADGFGVPLKRVAHAVYRKVA